MAAPPQPEEREGTAPPPEPVPAPADLVGDVPAVAEGTRPTKAERTEKEAEGDTALSFSEEQVAIGRRVEVEFADLGGGLALPRFRLADEPPEGEPWHFPG